MFHQHLTTRAHSSSVAFCYTIQRRHQFLPSAPALKNIIESWEAECERWQSRFDVVASDITAGMTDDRLCAQIRERALALLHAQ